MSLTITLVQSNLHWEAIDTNIAMFDQKLCDLPHTDVVILPEMFSTGFSMNVKPIAETMEGKAVKWMRATAQKINAALTGSLIIEENGAYYNRLLWVEPDGTMHQYDKKHLFSMAEEDRSFSAGKERIIIDYKGWKIAPFICYDLRFPVWARNTVDYDIAFYVANWPQKRSHHWKSLLVARAIENQAYVFGVNRVGVDGSGFEYSGDTTALDPAGTLLYQKSHEEAIHTFTISKEHLTDVRKRLPFLNDRDSFVMT